MNHRQLEGQQAGRRGKPNPVARADASAEALELFHAWHVATVERETRTKFLAGAPDPADPDLTICRPKRKKEEL